MAARMPPRGAMRLPTPLLQMPTHLRLTRASQVTCNLVDA
jgi:hypothetical protein